MKNKINLAEKRLFFIFASVLVFLLLLISNLNFVSGAVLSNPYYDNKPLKLLPGQSIVVNFRAQNVYGKNDVVFKNISVEEGEDIAEILLDSNELYLPFGTNGEIVLPIKFSMPATANLGESYNVSVLWIVREINKSVSAGAVGFMIETGLRVPILVAEPEPEPSPNVSPPPPPVSPWVEQEKRAKVLTIFSWIVIALIIIVLISIWFFSLRSKRKTKK